MKNIPRDLRKFEKRIEAIRPDLCYTLGKLEIMKLREDVRKKEGAAF